MPDLRWRASRVASFLALCLAAAVAPAFGASLQVLVDADNNTGTGCTVTTAAGPMTGIEQRFTTTVDPTANPPRITGVTREDCNTGTGTFGAPVSTSSGGWSVGVGNGTSGANVIETSLPLPPGARVLRVGFVYGDPSIGSDALITANGGGPILAFLPLASADAIPTLSSAMLALLAALIGAVGYGYLRRHGISAAPLAIVALSLVATLALAAVTLDGLIGDWAGVAPLANDPQGDAPDGSDIIAVFVQAAPPTLYVRADVRTGMPPAATADTYTANVSGTLNIAAATGLLANDTPGVPAGTVASYGGGSLGGAVTDHAAGTATSFGAGGSLTVNADGSFAFTPATGFTGNFTFDYRLSNVNGTSDATVSISAREAPAFTSAPSATFVVGAGGSFTLVATGQPAPTFALSSGTLPTGLSLNATSGVISGTPGAGTGGSYALTFTASNRVAPNATQSFTLTVTQAPAITSAAVATFALNQPGTFTVTTIGFPTNASMAISETGALPPGVALVNNNNGTATLSGTPTAQGTFPITITAANGVTPNATQSFTLTVSAAPTITSANNATFKVGTAGTFTITTTGTPSGASMAISQTGTLPAGVTFVNNGNGTATLAGTPTASGTFPITINAANGVTPNASQSFTLTVNAAPAITSASNATFTLNQFGTFTVTTTGLPTNASMAISQTGALPAGVTLVNNNNGTATLSGTPTAQGIFPITITAANGVTPNATQSFTLTVNAAPAITSANNATFKVGTAGSFTITTTGTPSGASMVISETGALPGGVTLVNNNDGTATLAGTPTTSGTFPITINAANGITPNASQSFTLTVNQAPTITSAASTSFVLGQSGTFTVTTTGFPTNASMAISETGALPAGVTLVNNNNGTATLAGTPTAQGAFPITITAANGVTPNASQSFTLTVNAAPAITSANNATFRVGTGGTFTITTTGTPSGASMAISETGALPGGVTLVNNNDGTATLGGTPTASGTFPITINAANGITPNASQSFTLTVNQAPTITSAASTSFVVGQFGTFTVTTTGFPTNASMAISETGALPSGVTLVNNNNGTATLSGTPTAAGTFPITIGAANGVTPNASQSFTISVNQAPSITSANNATFKVGTAGTFTITTTGTPSGASMAISETGALPAGVALVNNNDGTATLGGTPTAAGTFPITITAANGISPNASQSFTITVNQAPSITSASNATFALNQSGTFTVTTTGLPTNASMSISETGALPLGVTLVNNNDGTATLSGTPTVQGVFPITITAANGVTPNATQSFTLTVNAAPAITSANNATFKVGTGGTFTVTTTGTPSGASMVISETGALPGGVTLVNNNDGTATLGGTPTTSGTFPITINAANGITPNASQSFTLTVNQAPAITSAASASFVFGQFGTFTVTATGFPTNASMAISETGALPSGVTLVNNNNGTATLSGTPTAAGTFPITIGAANGVTPNASQSFTISVNQAPSITSANNVTFAAGVPNTFSVTTTGTPTVTSITRTGSALPAGVSFTYTSGANGTLAGTPTATGSTSFSFTASNGVAPDATQGFTLDVVCPAISVTPTTLANATLNAAYGPVAFAASGGSGSYVFTLGVGSPTGLSFTGASLGGTPTVAGTYTFTVTATDTVSGCAGATTFNNFLVGITANNDTFGTVIGNTLVNSASATTPFSVTANDIISPTTTISAFDSTSAQGGTVTMVTSGANLGQFTYDPPRGYTGTDTFTYTIADGAASATATVTITVFGRVWYVNNAAGACSASCDGRESHPYTSLAAFNAANTNTALNPQAGDTIFVYTGSGAYTGPLTLLTNQRLMGQGSSTAFSGLGSPNGQTLPTVPGTFPNLNALVTFTSGDQLAGFDMDGTAAKLSASSVTGFTVNVGRLRSTTAGASAFTLAGSGNSGTIDLKSLSAVGAAGSGNFGVQVQNLTGHFNVSGTDSLSPAGGTVSGFGASGLSFTGIAQCASPGTCSGNAVSLANMTISGNAISQVVPGSNTGCGGDLVAGDNLSCFANVYLRNIDGVSISGSTISNSKQIGINGNNVYRFTLTSTGVSNNGDEALESGLLFQNLHGTSSFTGLTATNNAAYQVYIEEQNSGSPSQALNLSIASSTFSNATNSLTTGLDGVRLSGAGGTTTFNVSSSTFANFGNQLIIPASALLVMPGTSTSPMNLTGTVQTSTFANALAGVNLEVAGTSNVTFNTQNNSSFTQMFGRSILYQTLDGATGLTQGTISGNTIGNSSIAGSACSVLPSGTCHGIEVDHADGGSNADSGSLVVLISGNTVQQIVNGLGIRLLGGGAGTLQATVTSNSLLKPAGSAAVGGQLEGLGLDTATHSGSTMSVCLAVSSNNISSTGGSTVWGSGYTGSDTSGFDMHYDNRFGTVVRLPGYSGGSLDMTAVQSFMSGANTVPDGVLAETSAGATYVGGASCTLPP